ncbi:MAG: CapA family protein, partial [Alphaproteobacteria bacterium]
LLETLKTLEDAGVASAGAGHNLDEARRPAILPVPGGRVVIVALGSPTSGIPPTWAAMQNSPGVNFLPDLTTRTVARIAAQIRTLKRPRDILVASLHWGGNWGYDISGDQRAFAHGLIDEAGVDVVWGHSSHHPKAIEVHNGKLILFGCGDFLDDYEGIRGYEEFRDDLVLMYFPNLRISDGVLQRLTMVPLQIRNFRLNRASRDDAEWLRDVLDREGKNAGTSVRLVNDNSLILEWN